MGIKNITHLKIDNFAFYSVENFNYLGSILNPDNKMNIEIAERIAKGKVSRYSLYLRFITVFIKQPSNISCPKPDNPVHNLPTYLRYILILSSHLLKYVPNTNQCYVHKYVDLTLPNLQKQRIAVNTSLITG